MKNYRELVRSNFPIQQFQKQWVELIASSTSSYAAPKDSLNGDRSIEDD